MRERVRVGLAGTSDWCERVHLAGLLSHPGAEMVAICGRNQPRASALAQKHGIASVFSDWQQMIAEAGLDALVVATPDDLHYPMTMAALDAGLHVLCEKPLAASAPEAQAMSARALAAGRVNLTMFTYRWLPPYRYLRRLLDAGSIGRIHQVEMHWLSGYGRSSDYSWRFDAGRGSGVLGDLGSHFIDLLRWYAGEIVNVRAALSTTLARRSAAGEPIAGANDTATLELELAGGAQASIRLSAVTDVGEDAFRQQVIVRGEDGTLTVDLSLQQAELRGRRNGERVSQVLTIPAEYWLGVSSNNPFDALLSQPAGARLLIDAIHSGSSPSPSFADGWKAQEVVDAALLAAQRGSTISLAPG